MRQLAYGVSPAPFSRLFGRSVRRTPSRRSHQELGPIENLTAPSLGRNLAVGANGTATLPLIQPGTLFENRQTQVDLRFTKRLSFAKTRVLANVDLFNLLNLAGIDALNTTYGPSWLRPTRIEGTRYVKFSAQVDF